MRFFLHNFARTALLLITFTFTCRLASASPLLNSVERRACLFFEQQSNPVTGLTLDRARNRGPFDKSDHIASIASTGYALASLPIAASRGWVKPHDAYLQALRTLRFVCFHMQSVHGWRYHFIDARTGVRVWHCEVSSIDTALLVEGALMAGQYWRHTEVQRLAGLLYDDIDWQWMLTNGGSQPFKKTLSMGWTPEKGFIASNWDSYCELMQLYLLGMGASKHPLPAACWKAWRRTPVAFHGISTLAGGPVFLFEMSQEWFDFRRQCDSEGWNYDAAARNGIIINKLYCQSLASMRKTYAQGYWGLNASDAPSGYAAFGAPQGPEDGTVSPTGVVAAILETPQRAKRTVNKMYARLKSELWGRYGFGDAFNLDKNWFDHDVLGIDLGMAMLALEDSRTGLPWRLLQSCQNLRRAWKQAGFHPVPPGKSRLLRM